MRLRRGLTLLELMVSLSMGIFIVAAATTAFSTAVQFDKKNTEVLQRNEEGINFEQRIRTLLRGAYVSATTTDTMTYFLGEASGNSMNSANADRLTFTTLSGGINGATLSSTDDFETLQRSYGPQGGVTEASLGTTPVGDQGQSKQGLFLREQRPADGDPTQGGTESVLNPNVRTIGFEFYNGTDWDPTWGTSGVNTQSATTSQNNVQTGQDGRRIPAAVRITYTLNGDPDGVTHSFVVQLPQSDVTSQNPVTANGTTTPGPGGTTGGTTG